MIENYYRLEGVQKSGWSLVDTWYTIWKRVGFIRNGGRDYSATAAAAAMLLFCVYVLLLLINSIKQQKYNTAAVYSSSSQKTNVAENT